jgi:hypothetical protein
MNKREDAVKGTAGLTRIVYTYAMNDKLRQFFDGAILIIWSEQGYQITWSETRKLHGHWIDNS